MSTTNILWLATVVVIFAAVAVLLVVRSRRRRAQASRRMGLPDLGTLSAKGLDQKTTSANAPAHQPEK